MPKTKTLRFERLGEVTAKYYGKHQFQKTKDGDIMRAPDVGMRFLKQHVEHMNHMLKSLDDQIIMITGHERSGKSTLGQLLARMLSPGLDLDDIIFPRQKIIERIKESSEGDTIIIDEAGAALFSQEWMEKEQRTLVKAFQQFGIKRLKVIIILPHRMLLNKQIRERRIDWWYHCYKKYKPKRIIRGNARLRYPKRNEWGVISNWKPLAHTRFSPLRDDFWDRYEEKKKEHVNNNLISEEGKRASKYKSRVYKAVKDMSEEGMAQKTIGDLLGYSRSHIADIVSEVEENPNLATVE